MDKITNVLYIGLDISLNNTGICINFQNSLNFYQLVPDWFKNHESSTIITKKYAKRASKVYTDSEVLKVSNANSQSFEIIKMIKSRLVECMSLRIVVEAPPPIGRKRSASYLDMIRANSIIVSNVLTYFDSQNIDFDISMIANTTIKKVAGVRGRGNCKPQIIEAFRNEIYEDFDFSGKVDDIADAYFATKWGILNYRESTRKQDC